MRLVLAERTGDREQLERARRILEHLGDRRSMRRLEAVAAELQRGMHSCNGRRKRDTPLPRMRQQDAG
jgi:hypothetical protein